MKQRGFTLIELLITISIIGILSTSVLVVTRSAVFKSKGANVVTTLRAIEDAFVYKALDDDVSQWWHEDDFPSTNSWAAYVQDLVNDDVISTFLPSAPDYPNPIENDFEFAYDADDDIFINPVIGSPECFNYALSNTGPWAQWNNLKGINVVIYPGLHPDTDEFRETFNYLDDVIDGGDGPYCGKMRTDARDTYGNNDQKRHHYFRYGIDFDLVPNH